MRYVQGIAAGAGGMAGEFLSYKREDLARARRLVGALRAGPDANIILRSTRRRRAASGGSLGPVR